jgi:hypothetical protein
MTKNRVASLFSDALDLFNRGEYPWSDYPEQTNAP